MATYPDPARRNVVEEQSRDYPAVCLDSSRGDLNSVAVALD